MCFILVDRNLRTKFYFAIVKRACTLIEELGLRLFDIDWKRWWYPYKSWGFVRFLLSERKCKFFDVEDILRGVVSKMKDSRCILIKALLKIELRLLSRLRRNFQNEGEGAFSKDQGAFFLGQSTYSRFWCTFHDHDRIFYWSRFRFHFFNRFYFCW